MPDIAMRLPQAEAQKVSSPKPDLDVNSGPGAGIIFLLLLAGGLLYTAFSIYSDVKNTGVQVETYLPFMLLGVALLIALGFEFVNGFHDTANAVATVIYTHSLPAQFAVVWSGFFNFLGVLFSTGAVAFGIVSLLPVELILQVGSEAGFAMVFALLVAAIIWNLSTWYLGLPSSSSHTLIGSIIGVGVANAVLHGRDGTSGVDWSKATEIGYALLFSPVVGFVAAGLLLLSLKVLVRNPALYQEPKGKGPPPLWIRGLLILTCTGVSFAHGSNDGQKGMGLIMLILIGTVPTAYALNKAPSPDLAQEFISNSRAVVAIINEKTGGRQIGGDPKPLVSTAIALHKVDNEYAAGCGRSDYPDRRPGRAIWVDRGRPRHSRQERAKRHVSCVRSPAVHPQRQLARPHQPGNAEAQGLQGVGRGGNALHPAVGKDICRHRARPRNHDRLEADRRHRWRKDRQAAHDLCARSVGRTRRDGDHLRRGPLRLAGLDHARPVVGRRGAMAANRSGLQWSTVRNLLMAWVLTLPMSILLAASLFWFFNYIF